MFLLGAIGLTVVLLHYLLFVNDLAIFVSMQRSILYAPQKYTVEEEQRALQRYGWDERVAVDLVAADKTRLRAYWLPMKEDVMSKCPTVLYLHVAPDNGESRSFV